MDTNEVHLEPPAVDLADVTVSAVLRRDDDGWRLTAVISRAPDQPRLSADDVTAELVDGDGRPLPLTARDTGLLVEAGGGLGRSTNAEFRFAATANPPARLTVTYRTDPATFTVRP